MLELKIEGLDEMLSALDRFADEMVDFRRVEQPLKERFHAMERGQFGSQGARGGTSWKPLSRAYAIRKEREYPGQPLERRTGALERSLIGGTPDSISRVDKESFEFGSSLPYAQAQHGGTARTPARPLVAPTLADEEAFARIILADAVRFAHSLKLDAE
ncbi:MAG: phage virion morphogenesis protein [Acidobacteriota bacterium]|nr:phage virion morphogenesis protein [Acidobacteriota bacterium]MDQ5835443.1 phage virion morphogenesis protein [Acidobacteriota bacterium]